MDQSGRFGDQKILLRFPEIQLPEEYPVRSPGDVLAVISTPSHKKICKKKCQVFYFTFFSLLVHFSFQRFSRSFYKIPISAPFTTLQKEKQQVAILPLRYCRAIVQKAR